MLSGIKLVSKEEAERLEAEDRKNQKKEHKHKHKKKHKKEKKDRKHDRDSDSSPSPERDEHRPDPRAASPDQPQSAGGYADQPPSSSLQRENWMTVPMARAIDAPPKEKEPVVDPDEPKVSARELNPHLHKNAAVGDAAPTGQVPGIGDGGASWRMKALRRAQSQAGEEGKGLSDVVAERWGTLGDLTAELTQGTAAHGMAHAQAARERRREASGGGGGGSRHMSDVRSTKSQMKRPSEQNLEKMSWRQERRHRGEEKLGESERGQQERRRPHQSSEKVQHRNGGRDDNNTVEAVLRAAAPEMNTFRNDGSFLDQFAGAAGGGSRDDEKVVVVEEEQQQPRERPVSGVVDEEEEREEEDQQQQRPRHHHHHYQHKEEKADEEEKTKNLSAAAILRARLSGKPAPITTTAATKTATAKEKIEEETIILPLVDAAGRAAPGAFGRESAATTASAADPSTTRIKRVERYDQDGQRKRYFADDDTIDLDTLVKRAKYGSTDDIDATMARNIAKSAKFKETDLDADAEYDWDAGLDLADGRHKASKDARRRGSATEEIAKKEKERQIREYTKFQSALDRCTLCFTSKLRRKHLTLAIGTVAYLALPSRGRMVPGHCQIIPAEHIASTRSTDESTWTEIRNFKKCLLQMFTAQGMDVIFIETALGVGGNTSGGGGQDAHAHAVVDCIPVPQDVFAKAPMYFRKAVDDATSEWAQHASKRMIDTSQKGLRGAIPPNFPYFHVEFGLGSGFVHVIDNPREFDRDFGRSVMIGLLKLPEEDMHRRAKKESERLQMQWATEFRSQFDEYDWTKML
jgi:hypothetical protein